MKQGLKPAADEYAFIELKGAAMTLSTINFSSGDLHETY
jgi:hypothetical protein